MKKINNKPIITICSSASFYKDVLEIEKLLIKAGFKVKIPLTANKMKKSGNFNVESYKTWFINKNDYKIKTHLMDEHFKKVIESDAILVVNQEKKGINGYIGGNVLMEMVIAYHYKKPIYLWNEITEGSAFEEEIRGLGSIVINQNIEKIKVNKTKTASKLVRDNIPDIMRQKGLSPQIHTASPEEYAKKLNEKLQEEVTEYLESENEEELADILEVINAIYDIKKFNKNDVENIKLKKLKERGGFKKRIILEKNK